MPGLFLRPCTHPGCRKYAVKGEAYCEEHLKAKAKENDSRRLNAYQRGYTSKWDKARRVFLMTHPLCVVCGRPATDVDHIVPHRGDKRLFWDQNNWQPLCHECHSRKTVKEDGGFGNGRKTS